MFRNVHVLFHRVVGQHGQNGQIVLFHAEEQVLYVNDFTHVLAKLTLIPSFVILIHAPITVPGQIGQHVQPHVVWAQ